MKRIFHPFIILLAACLLSLSLHWPVQAAANATLTLSPNKRSLLVGDQLKIAANVTVNEFKAGTIEVRFTYDSNLLDYVSVSNEGGVFPSVVYDIAANGQFTAVRSRFDAGFIGTGRVVEVTFKAKKAGTAQFNNNNSKIWEADTGYEFPLAVNTTSVSVTNSNVSNPPDTTPPSSPGNLQGNATGPNEIDLTWTAATDNVGITDYDIFRNGTKITTVQTVSFADAGLSPSTTYVYYVTARDAAGNSSNLSGTVSVTTAAGKTVTPVPVTNSTSATTATPKASSTVKSTSKVTTTSRATAIAQATLRPTTVPTVSTSSTANGIVSPDTSTVEFSNTTAAADGSDTVTVTVTLKDSSGTVITNITPEIRGLRENSDVASPFNFDTTYNSWTSVITSTKAGISNVTIVAQDTTIKSQDLTFNEPQISNVAPSQVSGSSFGRTILVIFISLLLLLVILFLLWRRLKHTDDGSSDAFPGADDLPPPTNPDQLNGEPDTIAFNPVQTLQRNETVSANQESAKTDSIDQSIPL